MAGMTYDTLLADVIAYSERSDDPFAAQVPQLIALAESRLAVEAKPLGFVRVVSGNLTEETLKKPSRWRRTKSFSVLDGGERRYLFLRSYEYCRSYSPTGTTTGLPRYYADYDFEHFFISPAPDALYPFELVYYELPDPLGPDNQTNWTTQYAPQLLLYATLMEAQPFLKTSERIAEFQAMYDRALSALSNEDQLRQTDASS